LPLTPKKSDYLPEFLQQLKETFSLVVADLDEIATIEESLNEIGKELSCYIEFSSEHCCSERQKMEDMKMQWHHIFASHSGH
jgi:hypothetical protein